MYDYYGYRRLAGSRAAETKSLGDVELVARGFNLLHPFAESGLGSYSTAGRGGRPLGTPRWGVGEVPIWGGLSDKEKILAVAAVLIGGYLFLNRKKASVFKKARMRANRPTCGACKDKLWSTDKLYKRNGRNVCAACKEFGSDAYTLPRRNPGEGPELWNVMVDGRPAGRCHFKATAMKHAKRMLKAYPGSKAELVGVTTGTVVPVTRGRKKK